ncbi:MAG: hypothetical protein IT324_23545 [Anaerolineae bacterium]|nr:hypothetical protein [Anaerolineae bacterium]
MKRFVWGGLGLIMLALVAGCNDGRARVVFSNQSQCGTITASLTNSASGEVSQVRVAIGERTEIIVTPDAYYDYMVDFTSAGRTADDYRCTAVETGKVRVPAGSSQTFTLVAETPVPTK